MTTPPSYDDAKPAPRTRGGARLLKGCGCSVGAGALVLGILITGNFDSTAWASALTGLAIGVLVFSFSGINGFWERD